MGLVLAHQTQQFVSHLQRFFNIRQNLPVSALNLASKYHIGPSVDSKRTQHTSGVTSSTSSFPNKNRNKSSFYNKRSEKKDVSEIGGQ
ncbi:hypothetical protein Agabi119p4_356 [Agaricus bisporus var. burnettii]|uniref:Uncharacterized protein n=1 Tax=Agaricus bisporus var. burnettii TaxID=192524 RepID=A0A8H7FAN9_AGABI|nr:hypothetical protein Agabi119p4_356 [Agaricus bisporus var. burnettii]